MAKDKQGNPSVYSANHAALIVDCADYYRAVYEAISKARHNVFLLGWDIDSRIELLRGEEKTKDAVVSDLISRVANERPDIEFYLLKWKPAPIYAFEREPLSGFQWRIKTPSNVHMLQDEFIPVGASHHQKIITVDDEIAFSGGMDIALGRWDTPDHIPDHPLRKDPIGPFGPHHDMQMLVDGEAARALAGIARWRWRRVSEIQPAPLRVADPKEDKPVTWPESVTPDFENIKVTIAQTIPSMDDAEEIREVESTILESIGKAQNFLYIENQYFTHLPIAHALNKRLRENPDLRAILISSYDPKGILEASVMWQGRIDFRNALMKGVEDHRVLMTYPVAIDKDGEDDPIRVHAKFMIVDDHAMHVGSSNFTSRSMGFDTECDLICHAEKEEHRDKIVRIRNELLADNSGRSVDDVETLLKDKNSKLTTFLEPGEGANRAFRPVRDEDFKMPVPDETLRAIGDPDRPFIPRRKDSMDASALRKDKTARYRFILMKALAFIIALAALVAGWQFVEDTGLVQDFVNTVKDVFPALVENRDAFSAQDFLMVCGAFVLLSSAGFPVTILIVLCASVFGPLLGFLYAMTGVLIGAAFGFGIGNLAGERVLRGLMGEKLKTLDSKITKTGVIGFSVIRMVPVAPFGVVNMAAGVSSVSFVTFLFGTLLGMGPGTFALAVLGDSLTGLLQDPSLEDLLYFGCGALLWLGAIFGMHKLAQFLENKQNSNITQNPQKK